MSKIWLKYGYNNFYFMRNGQICQLWSNMFVLWSNMSKIFSIYGQICQIYQKWWSNISILYSNNNQIMAKHII
jgi:hypothetical protein